MAAKGSEVANKLAKALVSIGLPPKAEDLKTPAARLNGLYWAMVAIGPGRY